MDYQDKLAHLKQFHSINNICQLQKCKFQRRNMFSKFIRSLINNNNHSEDEYFTGNYEFKHGRKAFFITSSGMCNLKCSYCITNRPRLNSSISVEDFVYLFHFFGENIYFIFSGLGDFFCGYHSKDQLLRVLLSHDVHIYLDINGVDIKELGDSNLEGKEKIDSINVSYHYVTMKKQRALNRWVDSIKKIQSNKYNYDIKMVMSPSEVCAWKEAVLFYKNEVQPITSQKLIMVSDGLCDYGDQLEQLHTFEKSHQDIVTFSGKQSIYKGSRDQQTDDQSCPAGSRYFRITHDGEINPCELFTNNFSARLGNIKKRSLQTFRRDVVCTYKGLCDCSWATNPRTGILNERNQLYHWRKMG